MHQDNMTMRIAWLYYMENMTQQQIAEKMGISRMKVIKFLNQAKSDGIVQFKINRDLETRVSLEKSLIEKYNLKDAFIIPTSGESDLNDSLGKAAAQYIEENCKPGDYINIGYGDTISKTVNHLIYSIDKPISLVSLSGGVSFYTSSIIKGAHKKTSESPTPKIYVIPAPLLASTKELAQDLLKESSIKEILDMTQLARMSVVGIGAASNTATIIKYNVLKHNDLVLLQMQGAIGDILSYFYDENGNIIKTELLDRLISSDINTLKNMDTVVGVAGGKEKVPSIKGAMNGKFVNVLVTDEDTAMALLA